MNGLDYAIITLFGLSVLVGVLRGAIRELVNILGWVAGFILAQSLAVDGAVLLADWVSEPLPRFLLAWLLIFLLVLMVFSLVGSLIATAVRKLGLGALDRVGGAVIGVARGVLLLVLLTMLVGLTTLSSASIWKQSQLAPWLEGWALQAKQVLPADLAAKITFGKQRA